jgi:DNA-directed RNA polymerase subunit K
MDREFSKYEKARIIGARALQISMNAPLLIKISKEDLEKINYDAIKIAEVELNSGVLPISVKRPFPMKKEEKLKRAAEKKVANPDVEGEANIVENSEIMELAIPEDEYEEEYGMESEEE